MNITKEEFNAYINGSLSQKRKDLIDAYLLDHPLERRALAGAIEIESSESFDALVQSIDSSTEESIGSNVIKPSVTTQHQQNKTKRISLAAKWVTGVAAAILVFFMVRTQMGSQSTSLDDYFDAYPDVVTDIVRGEESQVKEEVIYIAMTHYNKREFKESGEMLQELALTNPEDQNIRFYLAISEYAQGYHAASLDKFASLSKEGSRFPFQDGALWYRALALLQLDKHDEAKDILKRISTSPHYKKQEALDILTDL